MKITSMSVQFINSEHPLSSAKIVECLTPLGVGISQALVESYILANGGRPSSYVFENDNIDTVVSQFLPLDSMIRMTSIQCYKRLVVESGLVPRNYFPFAIDGGGDFFFVDMQSSNGSVYFYESESVGATPLLALNIGLREFWNALKNE